MSNLNRKSLILFIVEGKSDKVYLSPIKKMVERRSNSKIKFKVMYGDILTNFDTDPNYIENEVAMVIQEYLELFGLELEDIKQVVHIVDLDGCFVNSKKIINDKSLEKGHTIYYRDKIANFNRQNIIKRNQKKVSCLEVLHKLNKINYGTKGMIPYRIYYFSTNIDDYFFNNQNCSNEQKINNSDLIHDKYIDNPEEYRHMIESNSCVPGSYDETWEYIKIENNSLSRCTNFNKFFIEIIDKI